MRRKTWKHLSAMLITATVVAITIPSAVSADDITPDEQETIVKNGLITEDDKTYYYKDDILQDITDVIKIDDQWYNLVHGEVTPNTVSKNSAGWWMIDSNGKVNFNFTGFASNDNGSWYCRNGKVDFKTSGIVKDPSTVKYGYVKGGKLQTGSESVEKNSAGWWFIGKDGYVDFNANTLAKNSKGWWAIQNGKVNFNYNGLASNQNGTYKITKGKVTFKDNGVIKVGGSWYNIVNSKVATASTVAKNSAGWWFIDENGKVDFSANTVAKNSKGWWVIQNGKVNFNYNDLASNQNGTFKITKGSVTFKDNGVIKIGSNWYYLVKSQVTAGPTLAKNSAGWWYIDDSGKVDFNYTGFCKYNGKTWFVKDGKVDTKLTTLVKADDSDTDWRYIKDGHTATITSPTLVKYNGTWWLIKPSNDGFVAIDYDALDLVQNEGSWWVVIDGKVDFNWNGLFQNDAGTWYCRNGRVDFNYSGTVVSRGISYKVTKGKAAAATNKPSSSSNLAFLSDHDHDWIRQEKNLHHDAEYTTEWVVDKEAWDEQVVDKEAWDEQVPIKETHIICECGLDLTAADFTEEEMATHQTSNGCTTTHEEKVIAGYNSIHHDAEYKTVHHAATGHNEQILVKEAYDETVITGYKCYDCDATRKEAHEHNWTEQTGILHHDAEYTTKWVVDKEAWDEQVLVTEAWDEQVETKEIHEFCDCGLDLTISGLKGIEYSKHVIENGCAGSYDDYATVYKTIHHDSVYETVHHEATGHNEQVLSKEAWDETVVTGYECSKCGVTKKTVHLHDWLEQSIGYKCSDCGTIRFEID